jgi:hypothetical protein
MAWRPGGRQAGGLSPSSRARCRPGPTRWRPAARRSPPKPAPPSPM